MAKYVGVGRARKGWVGVVLRDDDTWTTDFFPTTLSLWKYHSDADRILVDVPIGLPSVETGKRECDVEARQTLGERGRSLFYAPVREAVYETNLEAAREINERAGYSIQNQAWGVVPRLREVDEFLDVYPGARDRIRETRPAVCFRSLKGEPLRNSKYTADGREERREILREEDPLSEEILDTAEAEFTWPSYAPLVRSSTGVLDAVVAAFTARRDDADLATLPEVPETDARGLPMEIVYPAPTVQTRLTSLGEGED